MLNFLLNLYGAYIYFDEFRVRKRIYGTSRQAHIDFANRVTYRKKGCIFTREIEKLIVFRCIT